jgi:DNA-binding response OmpR family regulator
MKNLLIAEDEIILSSVLKDRFEEDGWSVTVTADGEATITAIKGGKFDLVLLDLIMPKKDGFEVLKEIRSESDFKDLPILVLSNLGSDEDIKKALGLGATDYFVKTQHPIGEILEKARAYETGKKEE